MQVVKWILLAWMALLSQASLATMITIDPDDYAPGADLSSISPFVTLTDGTGAHVFASTFNSSSCNGFAAPTGTSVFSQASTPSCGGWASQAGGPYSPNGFAFIAAFSEAVDFVSIAALNYGYPFSYAAEFVAYDENLQRIAAGLIRAPIGELLDISISAPNIRYFQIGGQDSIAALTIDRLSFVVPEPATSLLFLAGIGLALARRRTHLVQPGDRV